MAPAVEHVAVVLHPETSAHAGFLRTAKTASIALGIKVTSLGVHNVNEIEPAIAQFITFASGFRVRQKLFEVGPLTQSAIVPAR
jgi:ABC-type uncharacterized transport system substrate-binding protein